MSVISSVAYSDREILDSASALFLPCGDFFELDPAYSLGKIYGDGPKPRLRYDIAAQPDILAQADVAMLPLASGTIKSAVFDPPFMFGTHGQTKNNLMNKRFTMFDSWDELVTMYTSALGEFYRVLRKGGILLFKCQDYTDSRTTMTHVKVCQWANDAGFYAKDLFILVFTGGRIYNPLLVQRHARKFHCYYWVFQK